MAQVVEGVLAAYGAYEAAKGAVDEIKGEAKQISDLVHDAGGPQNLGSGRPSVLTDYYAKTKRKFTSVGQADRRGAYNPRPVRRPRVIRRAASAPRRPQYPRSGYSRRGRSTYRRYRRGRYSRRRRYY